jgi:hypothetical protein
MNVLDREIDFTGCKNLMLGILGEEKVSESHFA